MKKNLVEIEKCPICGKGMQQKVYYKRIYESDIDKTPKVDEIVHYCTDCDVTMRHYDSYYRCNCCNPKSKVFIKDEIEYCYNTKKLKDETYRNLIEGNFKPKWERILDKINEELINQK